MLCHCFLILGYCRILVLFRCKLANQWKNPRNVSLLKLTCHWFNQLLEGLQQKCTNRHLEPFSILVRTLPYTIIFLRKSESMWIRIHIYVCYMKYENFSRIMYEFGDNWFKNDLIFEVPKFIIMKASFHAQFSTFYWHCNTRTKLIPQINII